MHWWLVAALLLALAGTAACKTISVNNHADFVSLVGGTPAIADNDIIEFAGGQVYGDSSQLRFLYIRKNGVTVRGPFHGVSGTDASRHPVGAGMVFAAGEAVLFNCWLWLDIGGDIRHVTVEGLAFHRAGIVSSGTGGRALGRWSFRNMVFHEKPQYWAASILWDRAFTLSLSNNRDHDVTIDLRGLNFWTSDIVPWIVLNTTPVRVDFSLTDCWAGLFGSVKPDAAQFIFQGPNFNGVSSASIQGLRSRGYARCLSVIVTDWHPQEYTVTNITDSVFDRCGLGVMVGDSPLSDVVIENITVTNFYWMSLYLARLVKSVTVRRLRARTDTQALAMDSSRQPDEHSACITLLHGPVGWLHVHDSECTFQDTGPTQHAWSILWTQKSSFQRVEVHNSRFVVEHPAGGWHVESRGIYRALGDSRDNPNDWNWAPAPPTDTPVSLTLNNTLFSGFSVAAVQFPVIGPFHISVHNTTLREPRNCTQGYVGVSASNGFTSTAPSVPVSLDSLAFWGHPTGPASIAPDTTYGGLGAAVDSRFCVDRWQAAPPSQDPPPPVVAQSCGVPVQPPQEDSILCLAPGDTLPSLGSLNVSLLNASAPFLGPGQVLYVGFSYAVGWGCAGAPHGLVLVAVPSAAPNVTLLSHPQELSCPGDQGQATFSPWPSLTGQTVTFVAREEPSSARSWRDPVPDASTSPPAPVSTPLLSLQVPGATNWTRGDALNVTLWCGVSGTHPLELLLRDSGGDLPLGTVSVTCGASSVPLTLQASLPPAGPYLLVARWLEVHPLTLRESLRSQASVQVVEPPAPPPPPPAVVHAWRDTDPVYALLPAVVRWRCAGPVANVTLHMVAPRAEELASAPGPANCSQEHSFTWVPPASDAGATLTLNMTGHFSNLTVADRTFEVFPLPLRWLNGSALWQRGSNLTLSLDCGLPGAHALRVEACDQAHCIPVLNTTCGHEILLSLPPPEDGTYNLTAFYASIAGARVFAARVPLVVFSPPPPPGRVDVRLATAAPPAPWLPPSAVFAGRAYLLEYNCTGPVTNLTLVAHAGNMTLVLFREEGPHNCSEPGTLLWTPPASFAGHVVALGAEAPHNASMATTLVVAPSSTVALPAGGTWMLNESLSLSVACNMPGAHALVVYLRNASVLAAPVLLENTTVSCDPSSPVLVSLGPPLVAAAPAGNYEMDVVFPGWALNTPALAVSLQEVPVPPPLPAPPPGRVDVRLAAAAPFASWLPSPAVFAKRMYVLEWNCTGPVTNLTLVAHAGGTSQLLLREEGPHNCSKPGTLPWTPPASSAGLLVTVAALAPHNGSAAVAHVVLPFATPSLPSGGTWVRNETLGLSVACNMPGTPPLLVLLRNPSTLAAPLVLANTTIACDPASPPLVNLWPPSAAAAPPGSYEIVASVPGWAITVPTLTVVLEDVPPPPPPPPPPFVPPRVEATLLDWYHAPWLPSQWPVVFRGMPHRVRWNCTGSFSSSFQLRASDGGASQPVLTLGASHACQQGSQTVVWTPAAPLANITLHGSTSAVSLRLAIKHVLAVEPRVWPSVPAGHSEWTRGGHALVQLSCNVPGATLVADLRARHRNATAHPDLWLAHAVPVPCDPLGAPFLVNVSVGSDAALGHGVYQLVAGPSQLSGAPQLQSVQWVSVVVPPPPGEDSSADGGSAAGGGGGGVPVAILAGAIAGALLLLGLLLVLLAVRRRRKKRAAAVHSEKPPQRDVFTPVHPEPAEDNNSEDHEGSYPASVCSEEPLLPGSCDAEAPSEASEGGSSCTTVAAGPSTSGEALPGLREQVASFGGLVRRLQQPKADPPPRPPPGPPAEAFQRRTGWAQVPGTPATRLRALVAEVRGGGRRALSPQLALVMAKIKARKEQERAEREEAEEGGVGAGAPKQSPFSLAALRWKRK